MRRMLSKVVINLLVIAIATPATFALAASGSETSTVTTAVRSAAPVMLRGSIQRAVAETLAAGPAEASQAPIPARAPSKNIRAQGGGGAGHMVMGIVSTVISIGATVYMLKYLKDQQAKTPQ